MKTKILLFISTFLCTLLLNQVFGYDIPKTSFFKNYTKKEYGASAQNWDIVQNSKNVMYFANNKGLLQFDGLLWNLVEMPNKSAVRSLFCMDDDVMIVGAYLEFGISYINNFGELVYESWLDKIPTQYRNFGEIWRIHQMGEKIIIQSFSHLFIFENRTLVKVILAESSFKYSYIVNNTFYIQQLNLGLFELVDNEIKLVEGGEFYNNMEIWTILPHDKNNVLIGSQYNGFYLFNGENSMPWMNESNEFIKKNNLYSAIKMQNGNYAFGSIQNGLIISNKRGEIISLQNKAIGLQNNTVLSLFEDHKENLWLGLDNGIDYIKTNSPLSYVRKKGGFGTGYTSLIFDNKLYAGTNQGLYSISINSALDNSNAAFDLIEPVRGQVWKLREINNKLYCAHNLGLFVINRNKGIKIGNIDGVWDIIEIPNELYKLLIGTYEGFYILDTRSYELVKIDGFLESSRRFFFDGNDVLWLSHIYKGVYKMDLNVVNNSVDIIEFYDGRKYLPLSSGNELYYLNNQIIATTDSGVYKYLNNKFVFSELWNRFFNDEANEVKGLILSSDTKFWCFKDGKIHYVTYLSEDMFEVNTLDFLSIANTFSRSFENILKISNNEYLIGNEDGFILYESKKAIQEEERITLDVRSVNYKEKDLNNYSRIAYDRNKTEIKLGTLGFKKSMLKLVVSIPYYPDQNLARIRYRINSGSWSPWSSGNEIKLFDLMEDDYKIDIQSSINNNDVCGELDIVFEIAPPIYRSWYAYIIYLIFLFAVMLFVYYLIQKKIYYEKRKESLRQKKQMIQKEIRLNRKAKLAESELIKLRNDTLKTDIRHKSKELANTTMTIIQKNKILREFKEVLLELQKEDIRYKDNNKIRSLMRKINKEIEHQNNWKVFEQNFDKVHENFLQRLKDKHELLTPKDMRLAAYLRMNLSSKEIAPLLNISIRSVEISRYRLRKKMILEHEQNLIEYLISL